MKYYLPLILFVSLSSHAQVQSDSTIDRQAVRRVIKFNLHSIRKCFEDQLSKNPQLEGKVVVEFTITDQGQVQSSKIKKSTLENANVENCMMEIIGKAHFPAPAKGTVAVIDYPFVFGKEHSAPAK